jgi:hypothetical protein
VCRHIHHKECHLTYNCAHIILVCIILYSVFDFLQLAQKSQWVAFWLYRVFECLRFLLEFHVFDGVDLTSVFRIRKIFVVFKKVLSNCVNKGRDIGYILNTHDTVARVSIAYSYGVYKHAHVSQEVNVHAACHLVDVSELIGRCGQLILLRCRCTLGLGELLQDRLWKEIG